jgi:photosystem II stability/assembly factor-like uncharacterized protein
MPKEMEVIDTIAVDGQCSPGFAIPVIYLILKPLLSNLASKRFHSPEKQEKHSKIMNFLSSSLSRFFFLWLVTALLFKLIPWKNETYRDSYGPGFTGNPKLFEPADHFFIQRSWPDLKPDFRAYDEAVRGLRAAVSRTSFVLPGFGASWTLEGPTNIGGRINVVVANPSHPDTLFAGCASGGLFRSADGGLTWVPVFDQQPFLSIGCIAFEPGNPSTMYVGTGDPNISGYPFIGDGIYKSTDGGNTWTHLGLTDQRIISKIIVDPINTGIVYAATLGLPFERNNERGLYKTTDGGLTWSQVLFISDDAGIADLVMHPGNPQVLYAAGWNRIRNNEESIIAGQAAKIYKTTDGGANWSVLSNGLPQSDMSRIGITISESNPDVLYAVYVNDILDFDGIYTTVNGGLSWSQVAANGLDPWFMGGFGWYFGRIQVSPFNADELFVCGIDLYKSSDGGNNWTNADANYVTHADKHDVHYVGVNDILLATDGGLYRSTNGGATWTDAENIPNTQFYRVTADPHNPGVYAGGAQDNGTVRGNASVMNNWDKLFGADGFTIAYNPADPNVYYLETQNGDIWATSDGGVFIDYISGTIDPGDRRNWDMPYILSAHDPDILYTGTYRIYRNTSGPVDDWLPISPDLTDGIVFAPRFHTITTVHESPLNSDYLYAGTSDGNVWRSLDGGTGWDNITGILPDRYVTSVKASPNIQNHVYATVSGYKYNEFIPHVFRSTDNGTSWNDISGNLPQMAVNDLAILPGNDDILLAATDGGIYATIDGGLYWERVGNNMPVLPVYDVELDQNAGTVIAGTHARSLLSYPVDSILLATSLHPGGGTGKCRIYPVPASDLLWIDTGLIAAGKLDIISINGARVKSFDVFKGPVTCIDVSDLPRGIYLVQFTGNRKKWYGKAILE